MKRSKRYDVFLSYSIRNEREAEKIHNGLLQSHSMGKSLVSYVTGHAICEGYISSVDEKLTGWDIIENTLYDNQVLIDLLNNKLSIPIS